MDKIKLEIAKDEALQLYAFLEKEYISQEFYPKVYTFIKRLVKFIDEDELYTGNH